MSSLIITLLIAIAAGVVGIALGWFLRFITALGKRGSMELEIKEMLLAAREEADIITGEAEAQARELLAEAKREAKEVEEKAEKTEERLIAKEALLDKRQTDIDEDGEEIKMLQSEIEERGKELDRAIAERVAELEKISSMSLAEARDELMKTIENEYESDLLARIQKMEIAGKERLESKARDILTTAIHRLGNTVSSDIFSTSVPLPNDDAKGKIIGKEGRNIKTFERLTGVELIIDDTPGAITISSFDPMRRYVARQALEELLSDGRIQPAKIESVIERVQKDVQKIAREKGEQAAYECGVFNLDPRIIAILGRLHFRTSYGQNVLQHSVEMAHIAGIIAEEIGADVKVAKAGALLHDIGKAVDHEVAGTHVEIGRRILQKFGADEAVIKAMQSHHEEYPYETPESIIVQVADAISGSRPGARRDSVENYLKRLEELEALSKSFDGVEKVYALQAGREIRIFVSPDKMTDLEARELAKEIAGKIESELKYPGEIKVTVIRENRVVEYAR